jgi:hypothetical protein
MRNQAGRWLRAGVTLSALVLLALHLLGRSNENPWDDAYFFKRIARNFVEHGTLAWNVSEGPVYGNTSLGFQLLAVALVFVSPGHYFAWLKIVSAGLELALLRLYLKAAPLAEVAPPAAAPPPAADAPATNANAPAARGAPDALAARGAPHAPAARGVPDTAAVALAFLAWASPLTMRLLPSGMDFHLGLVVLAVALLEARRHEATWRGALRFGAWAVATYVVRPDAAALPLVALTVHEVLGARRLPWRALVVSGAGVGAVLVLCNAYFGTPLPLSFYLKSHRFSNYDDAFIALSLAYKHRNAATVLLFALPLAYVATYRRRSWTAAALIASSVFFAFHFFSTIEVMGYQARFYLPGLVPLALAAIEAAPDFRRAQKGPALAFAALYAALTLTLFRHGIVWTGASTGDALARVSPWLYAGQVGALALWCALARSSGWRALAATAATLIAATLAAGPPPVLAFPADSAFVERHTTVRGLGAVKACLPAPRHIFHSEIGVPGELFPQVDVIDFAGLMHEDVARGAFDVEGRCTADQPEVIFLPHKVYRTLRQRVETSGCLRNYTRMVSDSSCPLFVRNDLADDFRRCAREAGDPWIIDAEVAPP